MKRALALCIAAFVLSAGSSALAAVRVKRITPDMLRVAHAAAPPDSQYGYLVQAEPTGSELYAMVRIPAGARLLRLEVAGLARGVSPLGRVSVSTFSPLENCVADSCTAFEIQLVAFDPLGSGWQTLVDDTPGAGLSRITRHESVQLTVLLLNADLAIGPIKLYYSTR